MDGDARETFAIVPYGICSSKSSLLISIGTAHHPESFVTPVKPA